MELVLYNFCHVESSKNSFPDYGKDVSGRQESEDLSETGREENNKNMKDDANYDNNANDNEGEILHYGLQTKDNDVEHVHEKLPVHKDVYDKNGIKGYTDFRHAKDLGNHFLAAKTAGDGNTLVVRIGNLGFLEFNQSRHPDAYRITGRDSWWRFVKEPCHSRAKKLIMYGYDLYDALQTGDVVYVCCCMIIDKDGYPLGQVLYKIGRTRRSKPRTDGLIYGIRVK